MYIDPESRKKWRVNDLSCRGNGDKIVLIDTKAALIEELDLTTFGKKWPQMISQNLLKVLRVGFDLNSVLENFEKNPKFQTISFLAA